MTPVPGAQWTGITITLAARLLKTGAVDAVLTVAPSTAGNRCPSSSPTPPRWPPDPRRAVPVAADQPACRRFLPDDLQDLRRLHQPSGRHHPGRHERRRRPVADRAQRPQSRTAGLNRPPDRPQTPARQGKPGRSRQRLPDRHGPCRCAGCPTGLRPVISFPQPRLVPRGREFARARVKMQAVETVCTCAAPIRRDRKA